MFHKGFHTLVLRHDGRIDSPSLFGSQFLPPSRGGLSRYSCCHIFSRFIDYACKDTHFPRELVACRLKIMQNRGQNPPGRSLLSDSDQILTDFERSDPLKKYPFVSVCQRTIFYFSRLTARNLSKSIQIFQNIFCSIWSDLSDFCASAHSYFTTTFLPLKIYTPLTVGMPCSLRPFRS